MKSVLTQGKSILVHKPDFLRVVPGFLCCDLFLGLSLVKKKNQQINQSEKSLLTIKPHNGVPQRSYN